MPEVGLVDALKQQGEAAGWCTEYEMGLLFWNFFGRRAERIYWNEHLPAREASGIP